MSLEHHAVLKRMVFIYLFKKEGGMSKDHRSQPEGVPSGQSWNTLNKIQNANL